jgi:hypothetical protein
MICVNCGFLLLKLAPERRRFGGPTLNQTSKKKKRLAIHQLHLNKYDIDYFEIFTPKGFFDSSANICTQHKKFSENNRSTHTRHFSDFCFGCCSCCFELGLELCMVHD